MSEAGTAARQPMGEAFDVLAAELDEILNRICRGPADLWLDHDPHSARQPYVVKDGAYRDEPMCRFDTLELAERWARTFVERTPGSKLDEATFETERERAAERAVARRVPPPALAQVIPLRGA